MVALQDHRVLRAVSVSRDDLLGGIAEEEAQVGLGLRRGLVAPHIGIDPSDRRLGADAERRVDHLELAGGFRRLAQGLVLPGEVDIADIVEGERVRRIACPLSQHHHVLDQVHQEGGGGGIIPATLDHRSPRRDDAELAIARAHFPLHRTG